MPIFLPPFGTVVPFWATNYFELELISPQNGRVVPKGFLNVSCPVLLLSNDVDGNDVRTVLSHIWTPTMITFPSRAVFFLCL